MSKFMYVASVLPLPDDNFIQNVKRSIFNFIWNKTDRIKRNTIIGKICDGGVGIVDFELKLKAIKASWICRISSETSVLYDVVNSYSNRYGVNIEYLLKLSETNVKTFESLSSIPIFYREILCCFNNCKRTLQSTYLSSADFVQQPLWNNDLFRYDGKTIFFKRWSQSNILYVKDLFDHDGNFLTLQQLSTILNDKSNWLCEYKIIKNVLKKYLVKFDMSYCTYTRISSRRSFLFHSGFKSIIEKRCKFFYDNLLHKKFEKPCYQSMLNREFCLEREHWKIIYINKIQNIYDKRVCEFNYKLLNNLLCCNLSLFRCKIRVTKHCENCNHDVENVQHLIFDCENVREIWYKIGVILDFSIQWRHILLGFFSESSNRISFLNELISFIAFKIYKYKMTCRYNKKREDKLNLIYYMKNALLDFKFYISATKQKIKTFFPTINKIIEIM